MKEPKEKPKLVAIVGPTCSGKSELAIEIARKFNGEIISADSRQLYRGLDISSSKVPGKWKRHGLKRMFEYEGIRHHLMDVAPLRKRFSVQKYKSKANKAIEGILEEGMLPILVGGSGFYVDTVLYDLDIPKAPPQYKLRRELEKLSEEELFQRLAGLDPQTAKRIDRKNKRRLIRAIEIVVVTRSPIPQIDFRDSEKSPYNFLKIGVSLPEEVLKHRIHRVVDERVKEGAVEEIKKIHRLGISWKRFEELGMEYKYIVQHLRGKISLDEMREKMKKEYWRYSKRQMVWFKKDKSTIWIDVLVKASPLIRDFLSREA